MITKRMSIGEFEAIAWFLKQEGDILEITEQGSSYDTFYTITLKNNKLIDGRYMSMTATDYLTNTIRTLLKGYEILFSNGGFTFTVMKYTENSLLES